MDKKEIKKMLTGLGAFMESDYGKEYRFAMQRWLEHYYKLGTYTSDYDEDGNSILR